MVVTLSGAAEEWSSALAEGVCGLVQAGAEERVRLGRAGRVHVSDHYGLEAAVGTWAEQFLGLAYLSMQR